MSQTLRPRALGAAIIVCSPLLALGLGCDKTQRPLPDAAAPAQTDPILKPATTPQPVAIDGDFSDWVGRASIAAAQRTDNASPSASVPLRQVWTTSDAKWVYFMFDVGQTANLQGLDQTISLQLDVDGNPRTGIAFSDSSGSFEGVDITLNFSPRSEGGRNAGVSAQAHEPGFPSTDINPYWLEATFAPTVANQFFELRLRRNPIVPGSAVPLFASNEYSARLVVENEQGKPIASTGTFTATLNEPITWSDESAIAAIPTCPADGYRLISWNVEFGNIFNNPEPFSRILSTLDPDIICFQETGQDETAQSLKHWLDSHLRSRAGWDVALLEGQQTAVATRLSSAPVSPVFQPDENGRYPVRAASLLVSAGKRRVLVTSTHLKCCGKTGDRNDLKRIDEAQAIRRLLRTAQYNHSPAGLIVAGDLNLVGSNTPLEIIAHQNDLNASDLYVSNPVVVGDNTFTTWRSADQPFLPGRLDYILLTDAVLTVLNEFVLDTAALHPEVLRNHGLQESDSQVTSDHLPLIVDFK